MFFFFGNVLHNLLIRLQFFTDIKVHRVHLVLSRALDLVDGLDLSNDIIYVIFFVFYHVRLFLLLIVLNLISLNHGFQNGVLVQCLLQPFLNYAKLRLKYAFSLHT